MIVVIHYNEIALKGKNRPFFENVLCRNILMMLADAGIKNAKAQRISGRILVRVSGDKPVNFFDTGSSASGAKIVKDVLSRTFGIKYFAFGTEVEAETESIKKQAILFFKKPYPKSFKIKARRSEKNYPFTSKELEEEVGAFVQGKTRIPVDLDNPKKTLFIEVVQRRAFLYCEKIGGLCGLPFGVSGKAISLISSGLDSPVASWYFIKRGCKVTFLHFHSFPYISKSSQENVKELLNILRRYSPEKLKLILFPFGDIQKYIVPRVPSKFRIIFYRRIMMRVASLFCKKEKAIGIVTGESLGQVASQTLENLRAIGDAAKFPVFRPLAGFDKEDIIRQAEKIGTYDVSILGGEECCTLFMPVSPATKCRLPDIKKIEKNLGGLGKLIKNTCANVEIFGV
ncbi:MAG: tRNA 4-thiouridine(8) synthase ThiI [Candidatus Tagabacteria bacterium RIFCSPLOWO2_01_FULL_39_11]|uniref:Probable tRNA sulfurtransferase n=1 Tax=Candidatus Tagabacteria bacterium RIFCSPLOWO2_01_FULL_39_11 TaxID=1802295 RepID=A0A1G2LTA5_9BACT|nr:MAG: tRNA 4-thiouridine(8) synthase ThiI [Candidatus Tagabacteria bacterium RIFCSPLOWO2_01_FULL_39_11]